MSHFVFHVERTMHAIAVTPPHESTEYFSKSLGRVTVKISPP